MGCISINVIERLWFPKEPGEEVQSFTICRVGAAKLVPGNESTYLPGSRSCAHCAPARPPACS